MSERVFRYEVPVDDQWHVLPAGYALWVGSRDRGVLEFWCRESDNAPREFRAFGTGHEVDGEPVYEGSTYDGQWKTLVWHLYSRAVPDDH